MLFIHFDNIIIIKEIRRICADYILDVLMIHPTTVEDIFISELDQTVQWAGIHFAADMRQFFCERFPTLLDLDGEFDELSSSILSNSGRLKSFNQQENRLVCDFDKLDIQIQGLIKDFCCQIDCLLTYGKFRNHPSQISEMLAFYKVYVCFYIYI